MGLIEGGVERPEVGAIGAVPGVVTVDPRQISSEGGEQVEEGPGNDDIVVKSHVQGDEDDCEPHTYRTKATLCLAGIVTAKGGAKLTVVFHNEFKILSVHL